MHAPGGPCLPRRRNSFGVHEMKVAFLTPEMHPLVRRTPLADLSHALSQALAAGRADVLIFLPRSRNLDDEALTDLCDAGSVTVEAGPTQATFSLERGRLGAAEVVLLDQRKWFGSRNPYGEDDGPYADNWLRYTLLSKAVLAALPILKFEPDVLHCLDWTTGLVPLLRDMIVEQEGPSHPLAKCGTFFQIHNLAIQGAFERHILPEIGLPHRVFINSGGVELGGKVNFLKAGAERATMIGTHSPGHAERIQEQDRGYGLEEVFRRRSKHLVGISNGIDYQAWDPENDPLLPQTYNAKDKSLAGKRRCKAKLQERLSLDSGPRTPIVATVGRFDTDSGYDILAEMLTTILEHGVEVVLMGAGQKDILERLRTIEATFSGRCRVIDGYQVDLAHLMMGGADMLVLPSHYAPGNALCAIGMRYGLVPIVYGASGLEDYVKDLGANSRGVRASTSSSTPVTACSRASTPRASCTRSRTRGTRSSCAACARTSPGPPRPARTSRPTAS